MTLLILGVLLWSGAHLLRRMAPGLRARLDQRLGQGPAKGMVAVAIALSVLLMVIGYRAAPMVPVYAPLPGMGHLNNLLMLISLFLFASANMKGRMAALIRHNMLWGTVIWAIAHLLVNGDLASLVLFGGVGAWAVLEMIAINRAAPWQRSAPGPISNDLKALVGALVLYGVIAAIHIWLGHNPFLGSYG